MSKKPPVYDENPAFQSPNGGNRHSETQQGNAARVRICRVSNLHAYVKLTLYMNQQPQRGGMCIETRLSGALSPSGATGKKVGIVSVV